MGPRPTGGTAGPTGAEPVATAPYPQGRRRAAAGPRPAQPATAAIGLALFGVLDALAPAERVAFVLHDVFAVPFDEIAPIAGRTPAASRQLASRARRRVQGAPIPDAETAGDGRSSSFARVSASEPQRRPVDGAVGVSEQVRAGRARETVSQFHQSSTGPGVSFLAA